MFNLEEYYDMLKSIAKVRLFNYNQLYLIKGFAYIISMYIKSAGSVNYISISHLLCK